MVKLANRRSVFFQLRVVVISNREHQSFRRQAVIWWKRETQLHALAWRQALPPGRTQTHFRCPPGVHSIRLHPCASACAVCLQAEDAQKLISARRAKKQTFLALTVVDQLAANGEVQSLWRLLQVVDANRLLAITVREHAVGTVRPS